MLSVFDKGILASYSLPLVAFTVAIVAGNLGDHLPASAGHQDSLHSSLIGVRWSVRFDAVVQGEAGTWVDGVGVVEGVAEFGEGGGVAWR
jgi:hypothetical protein